MIAVVKKYSLFCILFALTSTSFAQEASETKQIETTETGDSVTTEEETSNTPDDDNTAAPAPVEFSYDFVQLSFTLSKPKDQKKFTGGIDLGFSIPVTKDTFVIASLGAGSVDAVWGGFETANMMLGFGLGAGYRKRVLQRFDLIATAELFQGHVRIDGSPEKTNGLNLGIGGRGNIDAQREGLLFISYLNESQANKFSINLQVSHAYSKKLKAIAGLDMADFRSFNIGVRTTF